jgi:hypothetical protein
MGTRMKKLLAAAVMLLAGSPLWAATTPNSFVTPQTPRAYKAQIVNGSGTSAVTLITGGINGTVVSSLLLTNTDTTAYTITIEVLRSSTTYVLATISVPASAGNSTSVPPVSVLNSTNVPGLPVDGYGNPYLYLESTDTLEIQSSATVTSGKAVSVLTVGADF